MRPTELMTPAQIETEEALMAIGRMCARDLKRRKRRQDFRNYLFTVLAALAIVILVASVCWPITE